VEKELEIKNQISLVIRYWYIIVIFGIFGAIVGYALSRLNPPIYQTASIFAIGLNFDMANPLSQYEEDFALGKMAKVVTSDDVIEKALSIFQQQEKPEIEKFNMEELRYSIKLEQKGSRWELVVVGEDPTTITALANSWAEAAEDGLWEAYSHALQAKELNQQLAIIVMKLGILRLRNADINQRIIRMQELKEATSELEPQLLNELKLSRGLTTFLSFEWTEEARVPTIPVTNSQGDQILAGNLLGIIVGVIMVIPFQTIRNHLRKPNIS
jgi:hypothetical protein